MIKKSLFLVIVAIAFLYSCKQQTEQAKNEKPISPDTLKTQVQVTKDSMDTAWKKMIASDDQKFSDIKRLLQEVTFTKSFNPIEIDRLNQLADSVKASRYTAEDMSSDKIDHYDKATENLIKQTLAVVQKNEEMSAHTITTTLVQDISKADNEVVNFRIIYDRWAKQYNQMIEDHKNELQQLGEPFSSYQKRPLFELPV